MFITDVKDVEKKDPYFVIPKLFYFLINCIFYSVHGLMGAKMVTGDGVPLWAYSLIMATTIINYFGATFWSTRADRSGKYKAILIWTILLYSGIFSLQYFNWKAVVEKILGAGIAADADKLKTYTKWGSLAIIVAINTLANFFSSAIFPILDNVVLGMLASNPAFTKDLFGRQRLWGTIGHAFIAIFVQLVRLLLIYWKKEDFGTASELHKYIKESMSVMYFVMLGSAALSVFLIWGFIPNNIEVPEHLQGHGHHGGGGHAANAKKKEEPARADTPHSQSSQLSAESGQDINKTALAIEGSSTPAPPALPPADIIKEERKAEERGQESPAKQLLRNPAFVILLVMVFINGYVRTVATNYNGIFIYASKKDSGDGHGHGGSQTSGEVFEEEKRLISTQCWQQVSKLIPEIAVFFFGKTLMEHVGYHWMLLGSQLFGMLRAAGYGFFVSKESTALTIVFEAFKGLNTGLFFMAAVRVAYDIAKKGQGNTAQALMSGVYSGVAACTVGIVGAIHALIANPSNDSANLFETIRQIFQVTTLLSTLALVTLFCKFLLVDGVIRIGFGKRPSQPSQASTV